MDSEISKNPKFARSIKSQDAMVEAIYKSNIGFSLSEQESYEALLGALKIDDSVERSAFLGVLLNGIMSKRPEVEEVVGLIKAALVLDDFKIENIQEIDILGEIVVGVAGSGKKGIKSTNISSCATFVAAAAGAYIIKSCSSSTSSLTGSADFIEYLGGNLKLNRDKMEQVLRKTGVGFFNIEGQIMKFDAIYGGMFHAPHALSFALAALILPIKPNIMFYGLAHPQVSISVRVLEKFGYKNSFVVASTDNGLHFLDEISVFGSTYVCGNREGEIGKINCIQPAEDLDLPRYTRDDISPGKNIEDNVLIGLRVLCGDGGSAREDMVCVNSATILYLAGKVKNLKEGYLLSKKVISEGKAYKKLKDFIVETGGNLDKIDKLREYA